MASAEPTLSPAPGAPATSRQLEWGLYQIYWGMGYAARLRRELAPFRSRPDYVMFYRDLGRGRGFPSRAIAAIRAEGATPIVSIELWRWEDRRHRYLLDLDEGRYDEWLRRWARAARDEGGRVLLRPGFEMNGDWFTWSGEPERFVRVWRRMHRLFDEEGAGAVEWIWSPNVVGIPRTAENDMHRYYPGDEYVDWVALDGYNFGDHHDQWHRWESFQAVFEGPLNSFRERYPGIPVMIAETASAPGRPGQREAWIREAHSWLAGRPEVRAIIWFNYDKRREGEQNWRVDATEASLSAFNATFGAE